MHTRRFAWFGEKVFPLIELMIVIVIMGSMLALAAPRIGRSLEKVKLQSASRRLAAVLRYTRQMAISRKKEYTVTFDEHSYTYVNVVRSTNKDAGQEQAAAVQGEKGGEEQASGAGKKGLGEKGIGEKTVRVDLCEKMKDEEKQEKGISISFQKEGENEVSSYEPDKESGITFYPKGESSGGKVILAIKEPSLAFQIEVDPITGKVVVKRKTKNE